MNDTPKNPAYSADDWAKVARIQTWLAAGKTPGELSKLTGIKDGTRSQVLSGSYLSSPSKFLDRMIDAIDRHSERANTGPADIPFVSTSIAKSVEAVCKRAHADKDFGLYAGRVGIGKTTACRQYVKQTPSAVLIEAFEGIDHSTFMTELLNATHTAITKGTVAAQMAQLIRALMGSDRLIIVDEANWLPKRSFGALRRLSDMAGIGVVLVGTAELLPMVQDPDGRFGQISSRIGYWPQVARQITKDDAQLMTSQYFSGQVVADDAILAFWACCEGSARTLRNLLRNTYRASAKSGVDITKDLVERINTQTMAGRGFLRGAHD